MHTPARQESTSKIALNADEFAAILEQGEQAAHKAHDCYQFTLLINKNCDAALRVQIVENLWQVMKTLITRAGPGTKVDFHGNIAQIDTPSLTEGSSGITYVVDHFKGWPHSGHITLQRGERSRLPDHAAKVL